MEVTRVTSSGDNRHGYDGNEDRSLTSLYSILTKFKMADDEVVVFVGFYIVSPFEKMA